MPQLQQRHCIYNKALSHGIGGTKLLAFHDKYACNRASTARSAAVSTPLNGADRHAKIGWMSPCQQAAFPHCAQAAAAVTAAAAAAAALQLRRTLQHALQQHQASEAAALGSSGLPLLRLLQQPVWVQGFQPCCHRIVKGLCIL